MRRDSRIGALVKRAFDIVAAAIALLVLLPVVAVVALAIRLDSTGPVIFRQRRVGRHGREFWILKFRTMRADAEASGPLITASTDARITRLGARLRHSKLDELPQLLNVLRGDMSIVGPRPEVPRYVAQYPATTRDEVLSVRPGLTDFATIVLRDEQALLARSGDAERYYRDSLVPYKISLGARYARSRSLSGDLRIIGITLLAILCPNCAAVSGFRASFPRIDDDSQ
jgi:lipopolysaccharide/colanic/teichoic acid biosynthesis glycosyltransferase